MQFELAFLHSAVSPGCTAIVHKHFVGYSTLQLMTAGAVELYYGEQRHDLVCPEGQGWFWSAYPGPQIRFQAGREVHSWDHRYVAFTGPLVEHWRRAGLWPDGPQLAPRTMENTAQFDELLELIACGGTWPTRRAIHLLEGLLIELAEARVASGKGAPWLETTRQFLERSGGFQPDYQALAHELGMGLSTLRRKFKQATGASLHETFLQYRLESARRLLGETDLTIQAVAARLGYRDVYFFSAQFKQLSGVAPLAYRRSRQN